ncbi:sensor histidine kinase [Flavobacterium haoranii]|uniref:histidine kinase n=1 Tax=Flavobacterium haoranii TaxID=683124 RepID=A0A1M6HG03_9FLAO|nr:sensor histidine kinase [Flavobacterium haoranii]SHJ21160.1 Histidine kinase-, DNA gyrase B-, and HSP90-like ATPase [Flavobacterium haoranii]
MRIKQIIMIICVILLSLHATAQKQTLSDSIIELVNKKNDYNQKIDLLQKNIKEIYATKFDETIELAKFGYSIAYKKNDNINKGDFLRTIGLSLAKKGKIDSASIYYYRALKILEPTKNVEKLGLLYDDMARMYRKLRQPKRALEFYDKALKLYEAENNLEGIARINNESGVVYRDDFQDYKEANMRFQKSLRIQQERKDSVGIGYALEFLGYNQLLIKDYKKSENYLLEALKIREKLKDDFATMLNYTALGEYYKETKQYKTSNDYFLKSNAVAKKINFLDIQKYNYEQITGNYQAQGNYEKAFESLKNFNVLNDSLYTVQKLKDVEEIATKYETAEKEKKIVEKELALEIRNQWIFGLIALAIIIGLLGFILYKQQVLKNIKQQKDNELLLALEKIESQNQLQEQRLTISRDLHDNIGAQLSFIVSAIDTIKYYISDTNEPVSNKLTSIGTFAKETIQELRDTIWAMNKPTITINDLKSRIANFMEKAKRSHQNIQILLKSDANIADEQSFSGLQGLNIFRIIQEATNNAVKYSEATEIKINISKTNNQIYFEIIDNGNGFVEQEVEPGNGLLNMRKRALELGNELIINSEKGKGTSIKFEV